MLPYTPKGDLMATQSLKNIEKRIAAIRSQLARIGDMRPGTITVQYRNPTDRKKPFYQLSYTHKGKSHSEYVRPENLETVRKETHAYKRFKALSDQVIELSIKASRIRCSTHPAAHRTPANQSRPQKCT